MRTASPIIITRPTRTGSEDVQFVELEDVVALLKNFLIAPGTPHHVAVAQTNLARAKAVLAMATWGVAPEELVLA